MKGRYHARALAVILVLGLGAAAWSHPARSAGPPDSSARAMAGDVPTLDFDRQIMGRSASRIEAAPLPEFGAAPGRLLRDDAGERVAVIELPAGWAWQPPPSRRHTLELLVLDGELAWGPVTLARHGYAHLPAAAAAPRLAAPAPARLVVFFDRPRATDGETARVVPPADDWRPGVVAARDTGRALALEVRDLLWVEETGQRTWLLRSGTDLAFPWERHASVEEGLLLDGEWRMSECVRGSPVISDYRAGSYFWRPPGILHGGPETRGSEQVLWILRTPTRLTVEFVDRCGDG